MMNWKNLEGSSHILIDYYPNIYLEGLRKTKENLSRQLVSQTEFKMNTFKVQSIIITPICPDNPG
jgi:hypothetical protein